MSDLQKIPVPETIWQIFGFCEDNKLNTALKCASFYLKPRTSILILGPTGSGKGELAKELANLYLNPYNDLIEHIKASLIEHIGLNQKIKTLRKMDLRRREKTIEEQMSSAKKEIKEYFDIYHKNIGIDIEGLLDNLSQAVIERTKNNRFRKPLEVWEWIYTDDGLTKIFENYKPAGYKNSEPDLPYINLGAWRNNQEILYSELFGHERGAFTGAQKERKGIFGENLEHVIFLDELSKAGIEIQTKLLHVLDKWSFSPLGSDSKEIKFNGMLIFAMNEDPREARKKGNLLEDLYYRVSLCTIELPSLHDHIKHGDDIDDILEWSYSLIHARIIRENENCPALGKDCKILKLPEILRPAPPIILELKDHIEDDCREKIKEMLENGSFWGNLRELGIIVERLMRLPKKFQSIEIIQNTLSSPENSEEKKDSLFEMKWKNARKEFEKKYFENLFSKYPKLTYEEISRKTGVSRETIRRMKRRLQRKI